MVDVLRPHRPERPGLRSLAATFAAIYIGTSVALARSPGSPVAQSDCGFESTVSPDARYLESEVVRLRESLRLHDAAAQAFEVTETPVNRAHVTRATVAASAMPNMTLGADDFAVVMATRTRFPRSLDVDDEE